MTVLLAAAEAARPAGGAALTDIAILGGVMTAVIGLWLWMLTSYRRGGARPLRVLADRSEQVLGVPGWAAVPGIGGILGALITIWGATWDIGLHIDIGRDQGPFGTWAHYPLLIGLEWMFLMGVLAVVMAPEQEEEASPAALTVLGWRVPASAALMLSAGGFALMGFPLDDLWHRIFGQDVTLWGPTHTMFIGGVLTAGTGSAMLLAEGARTVGREPFRGPGRVPRPVGALLAGIFLFFWTAVLHEFNWGVPQYRQIWQPLFLALGGAHTMVLARMLIGRGGTVAALAVWLPMQVAMTLVLGQALGVTAPAFPLFVAQAALVELLALRGDWRRPVVFGVVAGVLVGTVGLLADYGWSHVIMPLPWEPGLLREALPVAVAAAVAAGVLGALMATALHGRLGAIRRPGVLAAAASLVLVGLAVNAAVIRSPGDVTATLTLSDVRTAPEGTADTPTRVADVTVRLSRPDLVRNGNWAYGMAWQGGGRVAEPMRVAADGTLRSTAPLPVGGDWKSLVRVHKGHTMLSVPVRLPRDEAIDFAGVGAPAAGAPVTRTMTEDTKLLQLERKDDGPMWAWTPAFLLVLAGDLSLVAFLGLVCVRVGRMAGAPGRVAAPEGRLITRLDRVSRRLVAR